MNQQEHNQLLQDAWGDTKRILWRGTCPPALATIVLMVFLYLRG